jgi:hypothetical protein
MPRLAHQEQMQYAALSDREKMHLGRRFMDRYQHVTKDRFHAVVTGKANDVTFDEADFLNEQISKFYNFKHQLT